jgi:ribonuclease inhibitor
MKTVILSGDMMTTIIEAHRYLASALEFPEYYGENLDALWDELSSISEPTQIIVINGVKIIENLGEYGKELLNVLHYGAEINNYLEIHIDS